MPLGESTLNHTPACAFCLLLLQQLALARRVAAPDLRRGTKSAKADPPNRPRGRADGGYLGILLSRKEQAPLAPPVDRKSQESRRADLAARQHRNGGLPAGGGGAEVSSPPLPTLSRKGRGEKVRHAE